jgi:hypothetical protein
VTDVLVLLAVLIAGAAPLGLIGSYAWTRAGA